MLSRKLLILLVGIMNKILTLIACFAVAICFLEQLLNCEVSEVDFGNVSGLGLIDAQLVEDMNKLNKYLVESVDSEDPEANLQVIRDALEKEHKQYYFSSMPIKKFEQFFFIKGKKLFLALDTIKGDKRCTSYSANILAQLDAAISYQLHKQSPVDRVKKILKHYIEKHYEHCQFSYSDRIKNKLETMDKELVDRVNTATNPAIAQLMSTTTDSSQPRVERLFNVVSQDNISPHLNPDYIIYTLNTLAKDDLKSSSLQVTEDKVGGSSEAKFKDLFFDYLINPCNYYYNQLNKDIFEQANIHVKYGIKFDKNLEQFYEVWLKHKLCAMFLDNNYNIMLDSWKKLEKKNL